MIAGPGRRGISTSGRSVTVSRNDPVPSPSQRAARTVSWSDPPGQPSWGSDRSGTFGASFKRGALWRMPGVDNTRHPRASEQVPVISAASAVQIGLGEVRRVRRHFLDALSRGERDKAFQCHLVLL